MKSTEGTFDFNKIDPKFKKSRTVWKILKGGILQSRPVSQMHEKFWLKQGVEPATAGLPLKQPNKVCTKRWYIQCV